MQILVPSCKQYKSLWHPFKVLKEKYWKDCPWRMSFIADDEDADIYIDSEDWAERLIKALPSDEKVLLWQDDYFLNDYVDNELIKKRVSELRNYYRLVPEPTPKTKDGELLKGEQYRVALMPSIWRTSILAKVLKKGENVWQFENSGTKRAIAFDGFYSALVEEFPCLFDHRGKRWSSVERGKITPNAEQFLRDNNLEYDTSIFGSNLG